MCAQSQYASPVPCVDIWDYAKWPELRRGQSIMEFHLVYQGSLPAAGSAGTRAREKQNMRRIFHEQLASIWNMQPFLLQMGEQGRRGRSTF